MTNKKHPASGWIKHTPGQPRPVPVEWIRAVKRGSGEVHTLRRGLIFCKMGRVTSQSVMTKESAFDEDWGEIINEYFAITHYRIKKKYRPAYAKQQEQEMTRHNPGKETMTVTPESTITGIVSETIALSCTDSERTFTVNKTWYDKRRELIDHWLRGGEIELEYQLGKWRTASEFEVSPIAMTTSSSAYRIKPRQPVAGEVQVVDRIPYINVNGSGWHSLCGLNSISTLGYPDMESEIYPSVKAYIARGFMEKGKSCCDDNTTYSAAVFNSVDEACQY